MCSRPESKDDVRWEFQIALVDALCTPDESPTLDSPMRPPLQPSGANWSTSDGSFWTVMLVMADCAETRRLLGLIPMRRSVKTMTAEQTETATRMLRELAAVFPLSLVESGAATR